ncbi:hypothetical protein ACSAZL_12450 [Methanosarcina sp. T3]|uniref:hypothetical protein n=1 Tax=Methanosarcina sp. T3 TaxID=3439062 RepID=UPI003F835C44
MIKITRTEFFSFFMGGFCGTGATFAHLNQYFTAAGFILLSLLIEFFLLIPAKKNEKIET